MRSSLFFTIGAESEGVILRFGKFLKTVPTRASF